MDAPTPEINRTTIKALTGLILKIEIIRKAKL